ncbi:MAG: hypothetical protein KF774_06690 [Planctomyces sp.]|nr:hypothetical protein [Planctomyces sp.]
MTYAEALAASVVRSVSVVLLGLAAAEVLAEWVRRSPSPGARRMRLACLALPFLTPNLVVGFGYRGVSLTLLNQPLWNELLYFALVSFELAPAAAWLLLFASPPAVSAEGLACARLVRCERGLGWRHWLDLWRRGPASQRFAPAALLFLLSFQEPELASLMQVRSWTERVFTDHTRGLPAVETIRLVLWPVLIQLAWLWPLLRQLRSARAWNLSEGARGAAAMACIRTLRGRTVSILAMFWTSLSIAFVLIAPGVHLVRSIWHSGRTIALQPMWIRELGDGLLLAVTCGGLAWCGAALAAAQWSAARRPVGGSGMRSEGLSLLLIMSMIPGLMGSLAIGLLTSATFQTLLPGLAYTPLPLVLAELIWVWPRAVVVQRALQSRQRIARRMLALLETSPLKQQQVSAIRLWWRVFGQAGAGGLLLVAWWTYLELMLPTLLSLPGFQPAPMLLYNHLHYGQLAALGVKLALILAIPAILAAVVGLGLRAVGRTLARQPAGIPRNPGE